MHSFHEVIIFFVALSLILGFVGLIDPQWVRMKNRIISSMFFFGISFLTPLLIASLTLAGLLTEQKIEHPVITNTSITSASHQNTENTKTPELATGNSDSDTEVNAQASTTTAHVETTVNTSTYPITVRNFNVEPTQQQSIEAPRSELSPFTDKMAAIQREQNPTARMNALRELNGEYAAILALASNAFQKAAEDKTGLIQLRKDAIESERTDKFMPNYKYHYTDSPVTLGKKQKLAEAEAQARIIAEDMERQSPNLNKLKAMMASFNHSEDMLMEQLLAKNK